jgi:ATP-binding cassette, subfamily B (MDR/TAP), member 6
LVNIHSNTNTTIYYSNLEIESFGFPLYSFCFLIFLIFLGSERYNWSMLNNIRLYLWSHIENHFILNVSMKLLDQFFHLSLISYYSYKKEDLTRLVARTGGSKSFINYINLLLFNIIPVIIDMIVCIAFFVFFFNMWFGIITFLSLMLYMMFSIFLSECKNKYLTQMGSIEKQIDRKYIDSIKNFESAKYYANEKFEMNSIKDLIVNYAKNEKYLCRVLLVLHLLQNISLTFSYLAGTIYCGWLISEKENISIGHLALFIVYIVQVFSPLSKIEDNWRAAKNAYNDLILINDLLKQDKSINNMIEADELLLVEGKIQFDLVNFTDEVVKLRNVSFTITPGQKIAIVGPDDREKLTLVNLLLRLDEAKSGQIKVDNQDIKRVHQNSLRKSIGVIRQDTTLFNNDIQYNIRYGNMMATDQEVENAAIAAYLHDTIMSWPNGYKTLIGSNENCPILTREQKYKVNFFFSF